MAAQGVSDIRRRVAAEEAASHVRQACEPLPPLDQPEAFGAVFGRFADARVVLLGEATHGTSEFYRARAAITRHLIAQHGFTIVAVEADWPDAGRIDRYVRHRAPVTVREEAFARFPTWMWRNKEVLDFVEWLRCHNQGRPSDARAEFRGLDIYSLRGSIAGVLEYLDTVDPGLAATARRRYGCLTPWQVEPADYGRAVLHGAKDPCEDAIVAQLQEILDKRLEYIARDEEGFFDAAQNARIVRAAEQVLPDHVPGLDGILESPGPAHVRYAAGRAAGPRRRREGDRLGAQLPYRQCRRDRDGVERRVQHR